MTIDTSVRVPPPPPTFVTRASESTGHEQRPQLVSALARRIHGWTWQAVNLSFPRFVCLLFTPPLVSNRHGHWRRLRYTVRTEG